MSALSAYPLVDQEEFEQMLGLDDEGDHEFSHSIVLNYFEQARSTLQELEAALEDRSVKDLYRLGHFLKGGSAAMGLTRVQEICEEVRKCGQLEGNGGKLTEDEAIAGVKSLMPELTQAINDTEKYLNDFFQQFPNPLEEDGSGEDDDEYDEEEE